MATSALRETNNGRKKKSSKPLIVAGILLLIGVNAGFWLYCVKMRLPIRGFASAASPGEGTSLENITLDPFIVNLAGGQGYLKLAMTLSIRGGMDSREKSSSGIGPPDLAHSALVRDTILEALSSQNADALLTAEGKTALKKTLKTALEAAVPGLALDRIYFTEFLVQR